MTSSRDSTPSEVPSVRVPPVLAQTSSILFCVAEPLLYCVLAILSIKSQNISCVAPCSRAEFDLRNDHTCSTQCHSTLGLHSFTSITITSSSIISLINILWKILKRNGEEPSRPRALVVRDHIGLSFGCTIPALVLFHLSVQCRTRVRHNSQIDNLSMEKFTAVHNLNLHGANTKGDRNFDVDDCVMLDLYTAMLASVGLSFAASSFVNTVFVPICNYAVQTPSSSTLGQPVPSMDIFAQNVVHTMFGLFPGFLACIYYLIYPAIKTHALLSQYILIGFTAIEAFLLSLYPAWDVQTQTTSVTTAPTTESKLSPLQRVFTLGEWITVSSFSAIVSTDYIFRYFHWCLHSFSYIPKDKISFPPSEMVVSQSGVFGVFISMYMYHKMLKMSVLRPNKKPCWQRLLPLGITINCAINIAWAVLVTGLSLDMALRAYCNNGYSGMKEDWCTDDEYLWNLYIFSKRVEFRSPLPIRWLLWFLSRKETATVKPPGSMMQSLPRWIWLVYWFFILFCSTPIAICIAKVLHSYDHDIQRKKVLTVVARKFFHFVAIALFILPTYYAPQMMSLSYAIAFSVLVLVESLRMIVRKIHMENVEKRNAGRKIESNMIYSIKRINRQSDADRFGLNEFFETFFDEKDHCSSFAVTHMALVVGCAIPHWLYHLNVGIGTLHKDPTIPFLGMNCLGVGDAAGAILGSFLGKTSWPSSHRTVEGSMAMLTSMFASRVIMGWYFGFHERDRFLCNEFMFLYLPLTILEAATLQIDNLCLPLVAFILSSVCSNFS